MKLIIDIPEEDYIRLRDEGMFGNVTTFKRAVREGIPLEQEPCEMTAEEYRQRMIQAFHNADCDELIAICVLPTEKEFEHLEWLLEKHYKAKPEPCDDEYIKVPKKALKYRTAGMVAYNVEWLKNHFDIERAIICGAQEPCNDAISRESVKNIIRGGVCTDTEADIEYVCGLIDGLPFVATSEKVGQWIPMRYDGYADGNPVYDWWECSECGWEHTGDEDTLTPYCPNCGSKMGGEQE